MLHTLLIASVSVEPGIGVQKTVKERFSRQRQGVDNHGSVEYLRLVHMCMQFGRSGHMQALLAYSCHNLQTPLQLSPCRHISSSMLQKLAIYQLRHLQLQLLRAMERIRPMLRVCWEPPSCNHVFRSRKFWCCRACTASMCNTTWWLPHKTPSIVSSNRAQVDRHMGAVYDLEKVRSVRFPVCAATLSQENCYMKDHPKRKCRHTMTSHSFTNASHLLLKGVALWRFWAYYGILGELCEAMSGICGYFVKTGWKVLGSICEV